MGKRRKLQYVGACTATASRLQWAEQSRTAPISLQFFPPYRLLCDVLLRVGHWNRFAMKIGLKIISIALLLLAGTESAFAGMRGGGGHAEARAARPLRSAPLVQQQAQVVVQRPSVPYYSAPAPAYSGVYVDSRTGYVYRQEYQPREFGSTRMTPQQKQAIRQSIRDAGGVIYAPRK